MYLILLRKTDMFVPVELFYRPIEHRTQVVGCIAAALGKPNGWLVVLCMGRINCHMLCTVGVALGNGSAFFLWREWGCCQETDCHSCIATVVFVWCASAGDFLLPAVLSWAGGYDGFVIVHLLCGPGCIVVDGGVGLGEYGKCIMRFGFGFRIE